MCLTLPKSIRVTDVEPPVGRHRVHTSCPTCLQTKLGTHSLEVRPSRQLRNLHDRTRPQTSAQVRRTSQNVPQMVVVHEVVPLRSQHLPNTLGSSAEPLEDRVHIVSHLHRNDAHVILLVHPNEKVPRLIVENTTSVRPMPTAPTRQQQRRIRLLEQVPSLAQLLLLLLAHAGRLRSIRSGSVQGEIVALQVALQAQQPLHNHTLHLATLLERVGRRQTEPANRTTSPASSRHRVVPSRVDLLLQQIARVHVRRVLPVRRVATVPSADHGIKQVLEHRVGLLITSHQTHCLDVRMSLVVNPRLQALGKCHSLRGLQPLQLVVQRRVLLQLVHREIVVLRQVRQLVGAHIPRERS
mmetsp:Transcript_1362/g.2744  ORF Transcript_1362/g.2744 Transcript_1362/m.2744 type:complete len:354 (+) Transcript_1362:432-1493(+)